MADTSPSRGHFKAASDPKTLRRVSIEAESMIGASGSIGCKFPPYLGVVFVLKSLTGLSLLTIPFGFSEAGLIYGAVLLFATMVLAFISATFMCEALTIANALTYNEATSQVIEADPVLRKELSKEYRNNSANLRETLIAKRNDRNTVMAFQDDMNQTNTDSKFKIRERKELGQMGETVLRDNRNKTMANTIYLMIVSFTYGTAAALAVMVNESAAHTICSAYLLYKPDGTCDEDVMYKYCVCGTFLITLPMCFGDLQKTKNFTYVIMTARFIAVVLMVTISSMRSYHRFQEEGAAQVLSTVKLWETDQFMAVFGNGVFLFAIHHYLPSMISPLEPQRKAPQVIATAFGISYVLILIVSATAMVAWGGEALECSQHPGGHFCQVQPLYNLNFVPLGWFGGSMAIFIASYPSMAIVNIPIAAITTRNTMAQWLGITLSGAENPYTFTNICMTLVVLVPPSVVALITKNVQVVIAYVGGYAGLTTAVLCPLVVLVKCRELLSLDEGELQVLRRPLKSAFGNKKGYTFVCLMYALALILVTKKLFIDPKAPAPHP